jgi:hypothetical protein
MCKPCLGVPLMLKKSWMVWRVKCSEFFQQLRCWLRHEYVFTHFLVWHIDPSSHMNTVTHVLHAWSYMYYRYYAKICQAICDASVWTAGFIIVIFSSLPTAIARGQTFEDRVHPRFQTNPNLELLVA